MSVNIMITKKNAFDLFKHSPNYTFEGKYGDRSRKFSMRILGEKIRQLQCSQQST